VALNVRNQSAGGLVDGLQTGSQLFQFLALTPACNIAEAVFSGLNAKIFADRIGDAFSLYFFRVTGLYSEKTGKTYDAAVVLEDDGQYANFKLEFDQRKGGSR
jgi:hypothetical protein